MFAFHPTDVRDWDSGIYIREWSEGLMCGCFSEVGKPVYRDGTPPNSEYISLPEDWEQFGETKTPAVG